MRHKRRNTTTIQHTPEQYMVDGKMYRVHRLAQHLPLITGEVFDAMVQSVRLNGLRKAILTAGPGSDVIVDGRNRLRAAIEAGVEVRFEGLPADADVPSVILDENFARRDLTLSQRAIVAACVRRDIQDGADDAPPGAVDAACPDRPAGGERRVEADQPSLPLVAQPADSPPTQPADGPPSEPGLPRSGRVRGPGGATRRAPSQDSLSELTGVSVALLRQAERVLERAPELAGAVRAGEISVHDAHANCDKPFALRTDALAAVRAGHAATVKAAIDRLQAGVTATKPDRGPGEVQLTASTAVAPTARPAAGEPDPAPAVATAAVDPHEEAGPVQTRAMAATPPAVPAPTAIDEQHADRDTIGARPGPGVDRPTASTAAAPTARPAAGEPHPAPAVAAAAVDPHVGAGPVQTPAGRKLGGPGPAAGPASGRQPPAEARPAAPTPEQPQQMAKPTVALVRPKVLPSLHRAFGGVIDLAICPVAAARGLQVKFRREPTAALPERWDGSVLAVPPVGLLDTYLRWLTSDRDARVAPAVLLAPLDPTDRFFDHALDHGQLSLVVLERDTGTGVSGSHGRLALYLFGVPSPSGELMGEFRRWGHVLLPSGGNALPVAEPRRSAGFVGRMRDFMNPGSHGE